MSEPHLSIVVPCYNEARRLGASLAAIRAWAAAQDFDVDFVIVDDGSSDGTADLAARELAGAAHRILRHARNRGKGAALRTGMTAAGGRFVLLTDADLSTPIDQAGLLLAAHEAGAPVVIGSRKVRGADVTRHQSWLREHMGKVYTWLSNVLICRGVTDFTCGFKSFTNSAAHDIFGRLREDGWAYDTEVLYLARRLGHRVVEVPVSWANDPNTRVNLLRDTVGSALGLVRIRWRALRGTYRAARDAD